MEQIESFDRVQERKTETWKIIHMSVLIILITLHSHDDELISSSNINDRKKKFYIVKRNAKSS